MNPKAQQPYSADVRHCLNRFCDGPEWWVSKERVKWLSCPVCGYPCEKLRGRGKEQGKEQGEARQG